MIIEKAKRYLTDSEYRFDVDTIIGLNRLLSDKAFLKKAFKVNLGYDLDLNNPVTFNEKLQWLKLYDRKPIYTTMVDKVLVKDYVSGIIGKEYIIPTIGIWDKPEDIDYSKLPDRFVLKCNHNSGLGMYICKDKSNLDIQAVNEELKKGLKQNYYLTKREWAYKKVKRKIIAEKYMEDSDGNLFDYKFFCYNGKVEFFKIDFDRFICHRANYYDRNLNLLRIGESSFPPDFEKSLRFPTKLDEMFQLAEKLSAGIPFVRVDFYEANNQVYFGELTFFPTAGFEKYINNGDEVLGEPLVLPGK